MTDRGVRWDGKDLLLTVRVQPRAGRNELIASEEQGLKVRLTAPPVDGKANRALERFLARALGTPASRIEIVKGKSSRTKHVLLSGISLPEARAAIGAARETGG